MIEETDLTVIPSATAYEHTVTADLGFLLYASATCSAPIKSLCHAVFDCDCESWYASGDAGGVPWHDTDTVYGETRHFGRYDPEVCSVVDWIDGGDCLSGEVSFPVEPESGGDAPRFRPRCLTPCLSCAEAALTGDGA